jgi:hypothetical protein
MDKLNNDASLIEINAFKKKITWGDVPAIYHMVSSSVGDLNGILTHGFDSAYKRLLNREKWNLTLLDGIRDQEGKIQVKHKADILLRHDFNDMGYELHCYPIINGETITRTITNSALCPFKDWHPEKMQMLFRINSLVSFCVFTYQNGDEADLALIKHAYLSVNHLIDILRESFNIVDIKGYSIAEFYQEINNRKGDIIAPDSPNHPIE